MMRRILFPTAAVLAAVVLYLLATLPPAPRSVGDTDPPLAARTIAGAFHVHTTRSDGAADKAAVARAAADAGLRFVVFTDHGDGTAVPDPPVYLHGVLCLDGAEISTNGGHYAAVGALPSPYPLGGDAAAVVEDVARLGGFGVAAHPGSPKAGLAWLDWSVPIDAVEWLNADSEWRDEPRARLTRAFFDYLFRPGPALGALLDRPTGTLDRWDEVASRRRVLALAGHDAHGGAGRRTDEGPSDGRGGGMRIGVPSYEASFRTFSTRVVLERPLSGDAGADGTHLLAALRAGRSFTSIDALARPATLAFTARRGDTASSPGDVLAEGPARLQARASVPAGAVTVLLHNGREMAQAPGGALEADAQGSGAYRIEVRVPGAPGSPPVPWLLSNPIFILPRPSDTPAPAEILETVAPLAPASWHVENEASSQADLAMSGDGAALVYRLGEGERRSQFVALAADLPPARAGFDRVTFEARSGQPMRVSVQVRFGAAGDVRWGRSVYLDPEWRRYSVTLESLVPVGAASARPDWQRAASILLVVDLTNARPGSSGRFEVAQAALSRSAVR
jgi:hypothetical protein